MGLSFPIPGDLLDPGIELASVVSPALAGRFFITMLGLHGGSGVKNLPAMQELQKMWVQSLGQEDLLEEAMATHSGIFVCRIPRKEKPSRLQSIGLQSRTGLK